MKTYKIELTTVGPLHVGSGETKNKISYVYDKENKKIHIPDERKMMKWLIENKLMDSFEKYFLDNKDRSKNLYNWIKENNLTNKYREFISYSLSTSSLQRSEKPLNDIAMMIKDKYNNPYIPGSSLKGVIRTALLATLFNEEDKSIFDYYLSNNDKPSKRIKKLGQDGNKSEKKVLSRRIDEKNDESIMKYLLISDSNPLSRENLILTQKIDKKFNNIKNPYKNLPIFRESIKPGTKIQFHMTIKEKLGLTIEEIEEAIKEYYYSIYDNFLVNFDIEEREGSFIYLGGGVGFQSKTVVYPVLDDFRKTDKNLKVVKRILDDRYPKKGHLEATVSPQVLKTTIYKDKNNPLEMGICKIEFEEI